MEFFAKTDKGRKRRMNQDYVFASGDRVGPMPNLFLLADGMGGHKAGDYASRFLVEKLQEFLAAAPEEPLVRLLGKGIEEINQELFRLSNENENLNGMGTTLVAAIIEDQVMTVANIGDSRVYLIHNKRIRQITRDHSFVEEMVSKGLMRRGSEEYQQSKNIITRAVGIEKRVEVDFFEIELEKGDYVLMCSDGLSNMVDDESILNLVKDSSSVQSKVQALIDMANINGGKDNIGVILIDPLGREETV